MDFIEYVALASIIIGAIIFASPLIRKPEYKVLACSVYEVGVVINLIVAIQHGIMLFIITNIIFLVINLWGILVGLEARNNQK